MNKKALAIDKLGRYLIILAVFIVILAIFFIGPGALFSQVQSATPKLMDFINPGRSGTSGASTSEIRMISQDALLEIASAMRVMRDDPSDVCFYQLPQDQFDVLFETYAIQFKQINDVLQVSIYDKEWDDETDEYDNINSMATVQAIEGVQPCLVLGDNEVERFYEWWFKLETIDGVPYNEGGAGKPPSDVLVTPGFQIKEETIKYLGQDYAWKTRDGMAYVLYKKRLNSGSSCMALFPVQTNWNVFQNRCQVRDNQLDDDCFAEGKGFYETANVYKFNSYWYHPEYGCVREEPTN